MFWKNFLTKGAAYQNLFPSVHVDLCLNALVENSLNSGMVALLSKTNYKITRIIFFYFRVLGSLLSAHLIIKDPLQPFGDMVPLDYDNELLILAHDVANRLLAAFQYSATQIPYPRVSIIVRDSPRLGRETQSLNGQDTMTPRVSGLVSNLSQDIAALCSWDKTIHISQYPSLTQRYKWVLPHNVRLIAN